VKKIAIFLSIFCAIALVGNGLQALFIGAVECVPFNFFAYSTFEWGLQILYWLGLLAAAMLAFTEWLDDQI
jgi:hypothetical protein